MKLDALNKDVARKFLESEETCAFTLMTIVLSTFPDDGMTMESVLLFAELRDAYHAQLSEETENRINAARLAMTTDLMTTNVEAFRAIVLGLVDGDIGGIPDGDEEDVDAMSMLWAVTEVGLLRGDAIEEDEFSQEVQRFIAAALEDEAMDPEARVEEDADSLEDLKDIPFFDLYILANFARLRTQLFALGADPKAINEYIPNSL